ncbi:prealbumin-like fold domain-containing protein, partial [Marinobacterium weihaiense]
LADATEPFMSDPLVHGVYSVDENVPAGWDLTGATCDDGSAPNAIDLQPGETVTCTFENTKRGMAEVLKTVSGIAPNGVYPAFNFQIRDGSGAVASATSDPITGIAYFSCEAGANPDVCVDVDGMAKLVPGDYAFCELDVQPGWTLTGSSNDGPLVWYSLTIGEDYIGECAAFNLAVAETEQFNIDNTPPPGGNARTIGFWKNWTSCDGKGNQYDRWLTDPDYYDVLDEFLPIYLHPGLEVTLCEVGVDILDKRDVDDPNLVGDGRKKASDAAYGLAAQLMAVQLNIAAEAGTCPAMLEAKDAAEALLLNIGFDGSGDYLRKPKGPSKDLAQQAKTLAGILDSYNNNLLCP